MASRINASLLIVVVFVALPPYLGEPDFQHVVSTRLQHADELLQKTLTKVGELSEEIKTEILEGPTAEAIIDIA